MADEQASSIAKFLKSSYDIDLVGMGSDGKIRALVPTDKYYQLQEEIAANPMSATTSDPEKLITQQTQMLDSLKEEQELDVAKIQNDMRTNFGVPDDEPIVLNKASDPVEDSPLGFIDRVLYTTAKTKVDKGRFLKEKFKAEDLTYNPKTGNFLVRNNGVWQNADATGLGGFVGEEADVIAGAIAGGAATTKVVAPYAAGITAASGGTAGPLVAGLTVGAIALGSGVGAAMARLSTFGAAKAAGIRTEQDAMDIAKELGKEGILAMGGEVAGPLLKLGAKGTAKVMNKSVRRIAKMMGVGSELETAQTMGAMTGLETLDNQVWLAHTDEVEAQQLRSIDWEANRLKPNAPQMNPVRREMADKVQEAVEVVHKKMDDDFEAMDNAFKPVVEKARVNLEAEHQLIRELEQDLASDISTFADPASKRQLTRVINIVKRAMRDGKNPEVVLKELSGTQTRTIIRNLGDLIKNNFKKGPDEISSRAVAKILQLRSSLSDKLVNSIDQVNKGVGARYKKMNADYSVARSWVDDFAKRTKNERVDKTVAGLFEQGGGRDLQSMADALKAAGKDPQEFLTYIRVRRAGANSTELYKAPSVNYTPGGTVVKGATQGSFVRDTVGGLLGLTSPKNATPLYAKTYGMIKNFSEGVNFLKTLPADQREAFLKSPEAQRGLRQIVLHSIGIEEKLPTTLLQKALDMSEPGVTPMLMPEEK